MCGVGVGKGVSPPPPSYSSRGGGGDFAGPISRPRDYLFIFIPFVSIRNKR